VAVVEGCEVAVMMIKPEMVAVGSAGERVHPPIRISAVIARIRRDIWDFISYPARRKIPGNRQVPAVSGKDVWRRVYYTIRR